MMPLLGEHGTLGWDARFREFGLHFQGVLLAAFLLGPLAWVAWCLMRETKKLDRRIAVLVFLFRACLIVVTWMMFALRPHLSWEQVHQEPAHVIFAVDGSASMRLGGSESQWENARRFLRESPMAIAPEVAKVELMRFARDEVRVPWNDRETLLNATPRESEDSATDFRKALDGVGSAPAAIVLFSDGRHTVGAFPWDRVQSLAEAGIPIFPVRTEVHHPSPDIALRDFPIPARIFKNTEVPIEIVFRAQNAPPGEITAEVLVDGKMQDVEHRKVVKHTGGDRTYHVPFSLWMTKSGQHTIETRITSGIKEVTLENNRRSNPLQVVEDRPKVLLIEGEARWEHHYVASAIHRDKTFELERVIFEQPRIGAFKEDELRKKKHPATELVRNPSQGKDPLFDYACIVLGDVEPNRLPTAERIRLERFVAERGGTLIVSAGKRAMPLEYLREASAETDPLIKMLPVSFPESLTASKGFRLERSPHGLAMPFLRLEESSDNPWPNLPKHFWAVVGTPKPGAFPLLNLIGFAPDEDPKVSPDRACTVAWHSYGLGKVLFVGLDSTWRWRHRMGDYYHHRFWGQLLRWASTETLLPAGSRWVRYGSRNPRYLVGDEAELLVRLASDAPIPTGPILMGVQGSKPGNEQPRQIELMPHAWQGRLWHGKIRDLPADTYHVDNLSPALKSLLGDPAEKAPADRANFQVIAPPSFEFDDLSMNIELLQALAQKTSGQVCTPESLFPTLADWIKHRPAFRQRHEFSLSRDAAWPVFAILLLLITTEWLWRRYANLD